MDIPIYKTEHYTYIRVSDLKEEHERRELDKWIFGQVCPLIQGEGKGVSAILDAVFLHDYKLFLRHKKGEKIERELPLDKIEKV